MRRAHVARGNALENGTIRAVGAAARLYSRAYVTASGVTNRRVVEETHRLLSETMLAFNGRGEFIV